MTGSEIILAIAIILVGLGAKVEYDRRKIEKEFKFWDAHFTELRRATIAEAKAFDKMREVK